ncbi:Hypothetical protein NTJ_01964 [Nesidiocoris tenuis]|uniref:Uncharacterized protein n=1 Tax=Nesidiocoris tenuis TaxID=355587 RepID=A0ABN7AA17_9HEMI|nr:Hypothetical protein NTJ_01964 [Nesidiocoris tenuis]
MAEEKKSNNFHVLLKQFAQSYKKDGNAEESSRGEQKGKDAANQKRKEAGLRSSSRPKQPTKRYMSPGNALKRPSVLARPRVPPPTYSPAGKKLTKAKQTPAARQRTPVRQKTRGRRVSSTPQSSVGSPSDNDENEIMLSPIPEPMPTFHNEIGSSYVRAKRPVPASMNAGSSINQSKVGRYMSNVSNVPVRHQFLKPKAPPPRPLKTRRDAEGFLAPRSVDPVEALAEREFHSLSATLDKFLAEPTEKVFEKLVYLKQCEERVQSTIAEKRAPPPSVAGSVLGYDPPALHHPNPNWYTNAWIQQSSMSNARPGNASIYSYQRPVGLQLSSTRDLTFNSRQMSHFF